MTPFTFLCTTTILAICLGGDVETSGGDVIPGRLHNADFDYTPPAKPWRFYTKKGDIVQLSVIRSALLKEEIIRTLKVELSGDAAVFLAVVEVPLRIKNEQGDFPDNVNKNLSCFVKTVKNGTAILRITPVGEDGKERPTREWLIQVGPKSASKITPPAK